MQLTKNFALHEVSRSATAERMGIDNTLPERFVRNAKHLAESVLQPLRDSIGGPVTVTSWYRCPALNAAVKGSPTSWHMHALAADVRLANTPASRLARIMREMGLPYHQLILEFGDWVHVSVLPKPFDTPEITAYRDDAGAVRYAGGLDFDRFPATANV